MNFARTLRIAILAIVTFVLASAPFQTVAAPHISAAATLNTKTSNNKTSVASSAAKTSKTPKAQAPKVSLTSPANKATVTGTQTITVTATDKNGTIANVQYQLDGANIGNPVTASPYSLSWDTTTAANGSHKLTAIATNTVSMSTTSKAVTVTINNPVVDPNPPVTNPTTPPANTNLSPSPKVSFTFDDGLASAYTQAMPTLAKYGLTGTDYVITGCVDMVTQPNTCHANNDTTYMTWQQVEGLQNAGWEIGSHTATHPCLASNASTDPDDCPATSLTKDQVDQELADSKAALAAHGINATDMSTPYGDYNNSSLAEIAKYYASQRGFADQNNNDWPYNDYIINDYHVEGKTTVAQVEAKIDDAIANNRWLVLTFHDIAVKASTNPDDYQWSTANLDQIAAYVKAKQDAGIVKSVNVNQGLVTSSTNLLANGSFNDGIADGWSTDSPAAITADSGTNGSYPDPTNSIKLTSPASGSAHLFSPKVAVDPGTTYMFKNFLNVQAITSGQVAFYVDEYDANGNWVSGQYLKQEVSPFVEDMNFPYKPSSANVKYASLQVIVSGTGVTAYLDNSQLFPTSEPVVEPPAPTNLVANGAFDDGITDGWTTDSSTGITADGGNHGGPSNPANSVKLVASANNTHLFSPKTSVDSSKQYSITTFLNIQARNNGEVAFYIDEYDINGNWISGQYKTGVSALGGGDVALTYIPTSPNVATASLQVIVVGNSGITAYVDDVRWYQN